MLRSGIINDSVGERRFPPHMGKYFAKGRFHLRDGADSKVAKGRGRLDGRMGRIVDQACQWWGGRASSSLSESAGTTSAPVFTGVATAPKAR